MWQWEGVPRLGGWVGGLSGLEKEDPEPGGGAAPTCSSCRGGGPPSPAHCRLPCGHILYGAGAFISLFGFPFLHGRWCL